MASPHDITRSYLDIGVANELRRQFPIAHFLVPPSPYNRIFGLALLLISSGSGRGEVVGGKKLHESDWLGTIPGFPRNTELTVFLTRSS
ncbi:hypothetical protein Y1Q_0014164 [Alligator mississippiensis]|uniref:Uncharacterized protein n=1 Tax=Alligator mississippiensis TaxID=8496 RepID=A0A151MTV9_ALLMI|nr:hypothetical protein Y1Q_0014164 [Alligator mississippiensis]